jgi:succinate dehydrogenase flavin-adding protein (antitoxin of CptAB toxin-antitoxin module)
MDFFLEKCATKANTNNRKDDDSSTQFLEDLDDDIMAVITTTTPLSAKDSMKLADRLIEVSSETISRTDGEKE